MHLPATPTALLFAYAFLSNIALAVVPRRAARDRRGGRARRRDVRDGGGADRSQPLRARATRAAPNRKSTSPPHDDESRRLPSETRGREAHLGPVLVPLVRRYSMNPIRHCAFAVVLSLAGNQIGRASCRERV